ncbi:unnamed protein product [Albugo candida]|uniref:Uncharacterized protein n=1 Tax=Albugo candida TaxID=65357 RepID=A0A024G9V6_9STRA|nr:unnamed protein product [Albugo candida]|eukprot:CCI43414.1 unnamed protein product [Albugo candida]
MKAQETVSILTAKNACICLCVAFKLSPSFMPCQDISYNGGRIQSRFRSFMCFVQVTSHQFPIPDLIMTKCTHVASQNINGSILFSCSHRHPPLKITRQSIICAFFSAWRIMSSSSVLAFSMKNAIRADIHAKIRIEAENNVITFFSHMEKIRFTVKVNLFKV